MQRSHVVTCGAAAAAALVAGSSVRGECPSVDFEGLGVGTVVHSQYPGVTFTAEPGSCPTPVEPIIVVPGGGTSSGSQALGVMTGCPDFSPDYLRMVFADTQRLVSFTLGEEVSTGITFQIRGYNAAGGLIYLGSAVCGGGVYRQVQIGSPGGAPVIKRVEIEGLGGFFECIDDLLFNVDVTPPEARFDSPAFNSCVCSSVSVTGVACDDDGAYDRDWLEYRRTDAAPTDPWTLIQEYVGAPVCTPAGLYGWSTAGVPHGHYYLRMTVQNACGLQSTAVTAVYVDKQFGTIDITSPANAETLCGVIDVLGSVNDSCGACFDEYHVEYATTPNGPYSPVDPMSPVYESIVINGTVATWDTTSVPDGVYYLRVTGIDICGNTAEETRTVTVSNAFGCGCQADLDANGNVGFSDLLIFLASWGPCLP